MANINWDSQELESTAAQVNTLLQNYDKTMDEIQQTLNTMEFRLKLRTDVDNDLSKLKRRVSQERSKMQQVRQTVNLAASKTTDLNGKLIGYTNDIGNLSIQSGNADIGGGNCKNFLEGVTLSSIGIGTIGNVISSFVSKIKSWFSGEKGNKGEASRETNETSRVDYSGVEHPNTVTDKDVVDEYTRNSGSNAVDRLRYYGVQDKEIKDIISGNDSNTANQKLMELLDKKIKEDVQAKTNHLFATHKVGGWAFASPYYNGKKDKDNIDFINCVWLARGQIAEILGEDIYANRSILHNGAEINWKHYADTGETINGHSISYYDASSKLTDAVKTLADSEPCSAMFYFPGHTMTIQRVENGKVYFTDNWTKGSANTEISTCTSLWKGNNSYPTTGSTLSLSIEEFANTYQKYNPKLNKMVIIK